MTVFTDIYNLNERGVIAENEHAFAMLTNIPIVPGHTLIISKREVGLYDEFSEEEKSSIESLRQKMITVLRATFGAEGFNFAWNDGPIAGQSVPHFHLHVLPRKQGDTGITEYEPRQFLYRPGSREASPEAELAAIAKMIQEHL